MPTGRWGYVPTMTDPRIDATTGGTNRWTKEPPTPGEDPREIDQERTDPDLAHHEQVHRQITHAEQETGPEMGTSSTTYDATDDR
jgi:hypothetical protein